MRLSGDLPGASIPRALPLVTAMAIVSCAARPAAAPLDGRLDAACAAPVAPAPPNPAREKSPVPRGKRVVEIVVRGARTVPASSIREVMTSRPGADLTDGALDADFAAVTDLRTFDEVRVGWEPRGEGAAVVVDVHERPLLGAVFFKRGSLVPDQSMWTPPLGGDLYDPSVVQRALLALDRSYRAIGYLDASVRARVRRVDPEHVDVCVDLDEGPRWTIESLRLSGLHEVAAAPLRACMITERGRVNVPGRPYLAERLTESIDCMLNVYGERGHLGVAMLPRVTRVPERRALAIEIEIDRGPVYRFGRLAVSGRLAGPIEGYEITLQRDRGELFSVPRVREAMKRIQAHHRNLTGKDVELGVVPTYHHDDATLDVELVVPGE